MFKENTNNISANSWFKTQHTRNQTGVLGTNFITYHSPFWQFKILTQRIENVLFWKMARTKFSKRDIRPHGARSCRVNGGAVRGSRPPNVSTTTSTKRNLFESGDQYRFICQIFIIMNPKTWLNAWVVMLIAIEFASFCIMFLLLTLIINRLEANCLFIEILMTNNIYIYIFRIAYTQSQWRLVTVSFSPKLSSDHEVPKCWVSLYIVLRWAWWQGWSCLWAFWAG